MSENYFYSSLSAQEIEDTLVGAVVYNSDQALTTSQKAQARANIGAGENDTKVIIMGFFDTLADLQSQIPVGTAGDVYAVGTQSPYDIYIWDATHNEWKDNGPLSFSDAIIDDGDISLSSTWSSQKINTQLSGKATPADVAALIDDTDTDTDTTWSSSKISTELGGKATPSDVAALVDDSTTSASKTWSSQKIAAEIDKLKWTLLWTNSAPTSSFSEKEIELDLSSKTMILVEYAWSTSASGSIMAVIPVRTGTDGASCVNARDGKFAQRRAYATTTLVHFYDAYFSNSYGSNQLNDNYCIPLHIYAQ